MNTATTTSKCPEAGSGEHLWMEGQDGPATCHHCRADQAEEPTTATVTAIVAPESVKVEWVVRYGDLTVDIMDPYKGLADDALLTSERGTCHRCMGTGYPGTPGASHYRGGKCFKCDGSGGKHETSTVKAEKARIATHPAVMAKLMDEMGFILANRHRMTDEQVAKFPVRA